MGYFIWFYTGGIEYYISRWFYSVRYLEHYFSLSTLLLTLFSPWKRLVEEDNSPGFNIQRFFESLMFNGISRTIGAIVRLTLLVTGTFIIIAVYLLGAVLFVVWIFFPILGIIAYIKHQRTPYEFVKRLVLKAKTQKGNLAEIVLENDAGRFLSKHLGIDHQEFIQNTKIKSDEFVNLKITKYSELINALLNQKTWDETFLRKHSLIENDLYQTACWWDQERDQGSNITLLETYERPGMGLELVYGYTPTLNRYSIDLSIKQNFSYRLIGREKVVSQMERILTSGGSAVLIGEPGVGKKTIVLEFAQRAMSGKLGKAMSYKRILEFDYNALLSESLDLNKKKNMLSQIMFEASSAGNVILMVRDIQRITNSEAEGYDFTDIFEEHLEEGNLKIIAVSTPREYERFISQNLRLRKFLKEVEATPPTKEEALEIMIDLAKSWEKSKNITLTLPVIRKILEESDRYITETPFPEKSLELLEAVVIKKEQEGGGLVGLDDANDVLSEKIGVSFAKITKLQKQKLANLEEVIHKKLINQDTAVSLIAKSIRSRSVGVKRDDKPMGSFLFLGPTGVGKTETAKVLAEIYYGSQEQMLRFDMAEYSGNEGLERLTGSVGKNLPGSLTTAIKNKPASLLLLDEFEKTTREVYNLFLALLDEGYINDAFGRKVNCKNNFVIATSNAGAEYIRKLVVGKISAQELQKKVIEHVLSEKIFSPELLNRFDGVVVFEPLRSEHLEKIARLLLKKLSGEMRVKNIDVNFDDSVAKKVSLEGYDPAFGARPMRRIVDLAIGDAIGKKFMQEEFFEGDRITVKAGSQPGEYIVEKID